MAESTVDLLRGLVMSAVELHQKHPDWDESAIEDYLNIFSNLFEVASTIDALRIENIPTEFKDGTIPFVDSGLLIEENLGLTWLSSVLGVVGSTNISLDTFVGRDIKGPNRAKQYFYAGF